MGISNMIRAEDDKGWLVVTEEVYFKPVGQRQKARLLPQYERQPKLSCPTTGSPSSKYVVYATAYVYRELYGKITDRKKKCVNSYLN